MAVEDEQEEDFFVTLRQLQESLDSNPDDPSLHFSLGELLWSRRDTREKAVERFMVAAKLNPSNGAAFRYLGHYYARISPEPQRAIKCYQRAVTLNPDDSEAGESLCDLLDGGEKESLEVAICQEAVEKSAKAFWASRRLGYLLTHRRKWQEAIQSLQHAIRGYPACADLWEALGLSYQQMGMFTAALKSYGRAVELDDLRVFALLESGNLSLMLCSFRKSIEHFQQALRISPQNTSAYYGLASALLGLAKECSNMGAFKWGASLLEEASAMVVKCTSLVGNFSCSWKLHGDIQLTYARCFPWTDDSIPMQADEKSFRSSISEWKSTCFHAARNASRSYQRALHLAPWLANLYSDVAIATNLCLSFIENLEQDLDLRSMPEKMCIGGILLEGYNDEIWIALGCLSDDASLKQHALIRGLQLDASLAVAWAYLGKIYREEDNKQLAQQAFDHARSIDPSLALPWAGMSADAVTRNLDPSEAYECCLRSTQLYPLAEVQVGLTKLALRSSYLSSSEVFGAIQQALQRMPYYPESHNLNGLACESRSDYLSAIRSYRLARYSLISFSDELPESHLKDISINLARSLCKVGNASNAVEELEYLKQKGQLDSEYLQIYAFALWQLGKKDMALSMTRALASSILTMEKNLAASSVSFICRLLYCISGQESAITSILKMPKELFHSSKVSFVVSAVHVLDEKNQLESVVSTSRSFITAREEIIAMHYLISLGKLIKHGDKGSLGIQKGVAHLRKVLHMYPSSSLLRNLLSYLLLCSKEWEDLFLATRCTFSDFCYKEDDGIRSAFEILGSATVACHAIGGRSKSFSINTCRHEYPDSGPMQMLQKVLHREPWNLNARYLLTLNCLQKAREERFPQHVCRMLERLIVLALSNESYLSKEVSCQYQNFQLRLCAAEANLQTGNTSECLKHAESALDLSVDSSHLFFAHLLLARAYAAKNDNIGIIREYNRCLQLRTEIHIGWLFLKLLQSRYGLQDESNIISLGFENCSKDIELSWNMWMSRFDMVKGLIAICHDDFLAAEECFAQACSLDEGESCLFLLHGAICLELARRERESQYISLAIKSLKKAKDTSPLPLPMVSLLLGQAEASLGSKAKWEMNLRDEWFSWPPELKPAEILFQMSLISAQLKDAPNSDYRDVSSRWILRAVHVNPSCSRYWKFLHKDVI